MLKVRNEKYLTIIYGFDYLEPVKNETLIRRKNVSKNLGVSNREYELGWRLAAIPYNAIHEGGFSSCFFGFGKSFSSTAH